MLKKSLLVLALALANIAPASAGPVYKLQETFASGAVFNGDLQFSDDFKHVLAVDGFLTGAQYGNQHLTWIWWNGTNEYNGGTTSSNFLMGSNAFLSFTWDFSNAPTLTLSNARYGNTVTYSDLAVSGSISDVPEPTSIALLGIGLLGFAVSRRKTGSALAA